MSGPLDGIRVVDLTVAWSGPGATAMLLWAGYDLITADLSADERDRLYRRTAEEAYRLPRA